MAATPTRGFEPIDVDDAWRRFKDQLLTFVLRRLGSNEEAEDVVNDVMVRLLRHRQRIESGRLAAWIFTTARNAAIDRRRRARHFDSIPDAVATANAAGSSDDRRHALTACVQPLLAMLSADDRTVLEQVELSGKSQVVLAADLNAPVSTIKSRVQRARRRLRVHLERCCEIELDSRGNPRDFTWRGSPDYQSCSGCDGPTSDEQTK